jgi:hypothetical protein
MNTTRSRLGVILLLLSTGCQSPGDSPSPSASAAGSVLPPSPSSAASSTNLPFPAVELPPLSRVRLEQAVMVFQFPGEEPSRRVEAGAEVVVMGGPRERNGETWYEMQFPLAGDQLQLPWVRIDDPAAVSQIAPTCTGLAADALAMLAWDRLTCFGGAPLTVVGQVGHCQGGVVQAEPEWLAYACWVISDQAGGGFGLHATPEGGITFPDELARARLTGHLDDPAAATCRYLYDPAVETWQVPGPAEQVLLCREAFVVDEMEILEVIGPPPMA